MPHPLRLLTLGHSYVVGLNRHLPHEMARQGAGKWNVTTVAPKYFHGSKDLRPVRFLAELDEPNRVEPVQAMLTRKPHLFFYGRKLHRILNESWDLVHAWEEPYIIAGAQVAAWTPRQTPLVFRSAQSLNKQYPPPFNGIEKYAIGRAAGWICSGTLVARNLGARRGYRNLPNRTIPLGVDTTAFCPNRAAGEAIHQKLGWKTLGPPVVGYLGRFSVEKGINVLLRALDGVMTPWRAMFVGAGPMEGAIREWAKKHAGRVRVCTDVTHAHVPAFLNAMDLLCAPSQTTPQWKEQFGRMIVEAWACGVPVLGSDSGEIPFLIADPGMVVAEKDAGAWSAAMGALLENAGARAEAGANGLQRAHGEFAWPVVARSYLDFFQQIVDSRTDKLQTLSDAFLFKGGLGG